MIVSIEHLEVLEKIYNDIRLMDHVHMLRN